MTQEITSKTEFAALAAKLSEEAVAISNDLSAIENTVDDVSDYDGMPVSSAASKISTRLTNLAEDIEVIADNIKNYILKFDEFDVNDFQLNGIEEQITVSSGVYNINSEIIKNNPHLLTGTTNPNNQENSSTNTSNNSQSNTTNPITNNNSNSSINNSNDNNSSSTNNSSTNNNDNNSNSNIFIPPTNSSPNEEDENKPDKKQTSTGNASSDITEETVIKPTGQTSSNGRTKRSALTDIIIAPGIPNDPSIDISKYKNNIAKGFEVTTGNLTYKLCDKDIELLCAIVSAESDKTYDDALAVITTILNRCETKNWINSHGRDPIAQATAPNQFVVYQHGSYERYINGKAPDKVKQAVMDALAGVRNHDYCSFRSNGSTGYSNNMISPTGNRYK